MRIEPIVLDDRLKGFRMIHGRNECVIDGCIFDRSPFTDPVELFVDINRYWATLPEADQADIWTVYSKIVATFREVKNEVRLHAQITNLVGELYRFINLDYLRTWMNLHSRAVVHPEIVIGDNYRLSTAIPDEAVNYAPERTYDAKTYMGLLFLIVAVRPMMPIWSQYIRETKAINGTAFKEHVALGIISETALLRLPEFMKLQDYVHHNVDSTKITMSAIVGGVGSAEMSEWIFAICLIRKVCIGVVLHSDSPRGVEAYGNSANVVANVYKHIETTITALDKSFKGRILDKNERLGAIRDEKASNAEKVIVKRELSDYLFILANAYASNPHDVVKEIDPTVPLDKIDLCIAKLASKQAFLASDVQFHFTQWVVHKALSARFIPALDDTPRIRMMGMAQAVLWHWGFPDLACLVTATAIELPEDGVFGGEALSRITQEQITQFRELYPHYIKRVANAQQQRGENVAMEAIDAVYALLAGKSWQPDAPNELMAEMTMRPFTLGGFSLPPDIKIQIANLILRINKPAGE